MWTRLYDDYCYITTILTRNVVAGLLGCHRPSAGGLWLSYLGGGAVASILCFTSVNYIRRLIISESIYPKPGHRFISLVFRVLDSPLSKVLRAGILVCDSTTFTVINDRNAEPVLSSKNDLDLNPTTLPSVNGSDIQWRVVSVRRSHDLITVVVDLSDVQHRVRSLA